MAATIVWHGGPTNDHPGRGKQSQGLRQHVPRVRQLGQILGRRESIADHALDFSMEPRFDLRIGRKQRPCPGQRVSDRIVACQEEGHSVVTKLAGRCLRVVLLRLQQQRQYVVARTAVVAPLVDDIIDDRVELAPCGFCTTARRHDRNESVHRWHGAGDGGVDFRSYSDQVGAEQRLSGDRESQALHLACDVERDTWLPMFPASSGVGNGDGRVPLDSLTMKCRLHDTSPCRMQGLFCCQESIAQERLCALEAAAFHEPVLMGQEHVFNGRRVIEEKREPRAESKGDDVVRALGQLSQKRERVGLPSAEGPEGAGWIRW